MNEEKWKKFWDIFRQNQGRDLNPFAPQTGYGDLQAQPTPNPMQPPQPAQQTAPIAPPQGQTVPPTAPVSKKIGKIDGQMPEEQKMPADIAMQFLPPWVLKAMGGFKPSDAPNTKYISGGGF